MKEASAKDLQVNITDGEGEDAVSDSLSTATLLRYFKKMGRSFFTRSTLEKRLPIAKWGPTYNLECLQGDVLAGLTVGLTVIPQGIAYAKVAGVPPTYGLYSAFVGCFVYMFFGSCKDITIGPTAIMSFMTHEYTSKLPCNSDLDNVADMAVLLAFLTGFVILLAAVFRIGFLITFIGRTVIIGFTSAAAISIASSQVNSLLGFSTDAEGFIQTWTEIFKHISETRWQDATLGAICCVVLLFLRSLRNFNFAKPNSEDGLGKRIFKKILFLSSVGRNAIVVIFCCAMAYVLRDNQPFSLSDDIDPGLPDVGLPSFSLSCNSSTNTSSGVEYTYEYYNFGQVLGLFGTGLAIVPIIGILEDIAIASAFSQGKAIDATQEMVALGFCNFVGSFFQSIPTTGSFSRTAVNATSGVKTQAGGIVTGLLVIFALLFLTPAFKYIPKTSLAAVIICAVIFMVEYHDIVPIWKTYKLDQIPLWTTFLVCLLWKLEWGILVGAGVNICLLLYLQATPTVTVSPREIHNSESAVVVVQPSLGLMFPSAEFVKKRIFAAGVQNLPLTVVVDCAHVAVVDYTAALAVQSLFKEFTKRDQKVVFSNMNTKVSLSLHALLPTLEEVSLEAPPPPPTSSTAMLSPEKNSISNNHSGSRDSVAPEVGSSKEVESQDLELQSSPSRSEGTKSTVPSASKEGEEEADEPLLGKEDDPPVVIVSKS